MTIALLLTACGSGTQQPQGSTTDSSAGGTRYPLKLDTKYGSTTLEKKPKRVVALGDLDDALALGVIPVASFKPAGDASDIYDYEKSALTKAKPSSPVGSISKLFDPYADIDFEAIAALKPDAILAAGYWDLGKNYKKLSDIAPVVALPSGTTSSWQARHRIVAKALGRERKGKRNIAGVEKDFAAARRANPGFTKLTLNYAVVYPTQVTYMSVPNTEESWFFNKLGFRPGPHHKKFAKPYPKDVVSEEQTSLLDADVVVIGYHSLLKADQRKKFEESQLFQELPAVKKGTYIALPKGHDSSIPQPGVLSSPDDLKAVLPLLERAVKKAKAS